MKILVTGGAGFIGSAVSRALMDCKDEVVIIDNFNDYYDPKLKEARIKIFLKGYKFKLYRGDIRDQAFLEKIFKKEKIDKVVHLAAMAGVRYSIKNPSLYADVNIMGIINLLDLSVKYKINNFIFASSSSVYGNNKKVPFSESDSVDRPISPYAATKKSSELIAHVYSHLYGLPTTALRFFTVYGPWGRPDMAYFKFTEKITNGEAIDVYNKGEMFRDFTYIDDIVDGIIRTLDRPAKYEIMNIGGNRPEKLTKFIDVLEKNIGKKAKRNFMSMQPGDVLRTIADGKKLRKLGWKPKVKIEEGLKKFVDWYRKYYEI